MQKNPSAFLLVWTYLHGAEQLAGLECHLLALLAAVGQLAAEFGRAGSTLAG